MLCTWRAEGRWAPLQRHAKFCFTWSTPTQLRDVLSSSTSLHDWLVGKSVPRCVCCKLLVKEPSWPSVIIDGQEHVAASAGTTPWLEHLQNLAKWPATLSLPPRWHDIAAHVRHCFRSLRRRCKQKQSHAATDKAMLECNEALWFLFRTCLRDQRKFPLSWQQVDAAKIIRTVCVCD